MKKISKTEAKKQIKEFFSNIKNKNNKDIKKTKRLAMKHNIPLKEKRKLFCRKCLSPYKSPIIRIKNKIKRVICKECGYVSRWRVRCSVIL